MTIGEKARIAAAGGFVDFGRVNGNLALSRAIGDFEFKKSAELSPEQQIVTAYPDVTVHELTDDDEFLVIACDGRFCVISEFGLWLLTTLFCIKVSGTASHLSQSSSLSGGALQPNRSSLRSVRT